eukprot:3519478-Amphidinium_carterae.1
MLLDPDCFTCVKPHGSHTNAPSPCCNLSVRNPLQVTGQLGSVMNESSEISLTYARLFTRELDSTNTFLNDAHIHLHVPEGAVPKDCRVTTPIGRTPKSLLLDTP